MSFVTERSTGTAIAVSNQGVLISSAASSFDAEGAGIVASAVGNAITFTVSGGGSSTLKSETSSTTPNGSTTSFSFAHNVGIIVFNGVAAFVGGTLASVSGTTAVFNTAPAVGDDVKNAYAG